VGVQRLVGGRNRDPQSLGVAVFDEPLEALHRCFDVARGEAGKDEADGRHVLLPRPRFDLVRETRRLRTAPAPAKGHRQSAERERVPSPLARAAAGIDRHPVVADRRRGRSEDIEGLQ
jgi:hypothetical protein